MIVEREMMMMIFKITMMNMMMTTMMIVLMILMMIFSSFTAGPANLKPWPVPSDVVTVCDF